MGRCGATNFPDGPNNEALDSAQAPIESQGITPNTINSGVGNLVTSMRCTLTLSLFAFLAIPAALAAPAERVLDDRLHHLRAAGAREWTDFPEKPEAPGLLVHFPGESNAREATLKLRQLDVKEDWRVALNGQEIGRLRQDENDMVVCIPIPPSRLKVGDNTLSVRQVGAVPDDVRVGQIALDDRPVHEVLGEATVDVTVLDGGTNAPVPCRLTVVNADGALVMTGAESGGQLAVRPGVIYTGNGHAEFGLPAGRYTIYAGRGFEYAIEAAPIELKPGDHVSRRLAIRREVPLAGYISCDTHVHTLTFSGHGDATLDERMLTLAGEGIDMPIATDHNRQVDYEAAATRLGARRWFTPVVGNEVTTDVGHFCIFPAPAGGPLPNARLKAWDAIFDSIESHTHAPVVIFNHPCDEHVGYRPFAPEHFNAATGENLDGWVLRANGIEVINSGAMQSDPMLPYRGWFAMMNRGVMLTPVGASDSHDVARYIVGQGRTYIRAEARDAGKIDVREAVAAFRAGRVLVSCGLVADITVNDRYGPGELVPASDSVRVTVRVLGPGWTTAQTVALYANGEKIREATIEDGGKPGVKWSGHWDLPRFKQDVFLVAMATGPGVRAPYWPIAKPYQPSSPEVNRMVMGSTGAVWIDADGDGKRTSAYEYARRLLARTGPNAAEVIRALRDDDQATATQAAGMLQAAGVSVEDPAILQAASSAGPQVERGFRRFIDAFRESRTARDKFGGRGKVDAGR